MDTNGFKSTLVQVGKVLFKKLQNSLVFFPAREYEEKV